MVFLAVTLTDHSRATVEAFEHGVPALEGLVSCHHVTGDTDYLLRVDVADVPALDQLTRHRLPVIPGVARFTTSLATSSVTDDATAGLSPRLRR